MNKYSTELTKELRINGVNKVYRVYTFELNEIYLNDKNDRIFTEMSKEDVSKLIELREQNIKEYNRKMKDLVKKSNTTSFERTRNNIEIHGQNEPGVILKDGRVIDGNRRLSCLLELADKNPHINYRFKAVLLEDLDENDAQTIKSLELNLQFAKETVQAYNPFDKALGAYKAIVDDKILTFDQYVEESNISKKEVQEYITISEVLIEILDWINEPNKFYLAIENSWYDPIKECCKALKKFKEMSLPEDEFNRRKACLFFNTVMSANDKTRYLRDIVKILENEKVAETFLTKEQEIFDMFLKEINDFDKVTNDANKFQIHKKNLLNKPEFVTDFRALPHAASEMLFLYNEKAKWKSLLNKSLNCLSTVDMDLARVMPAKDKEDFKKMLEEIKEKIEAMNQEIYGSN
ncbi:hypothetical protein [Mycoplasma sp. VS410B]|uniref:hypothetical protein n=1 Tax=Mycoplasma sp. VS410B TaxID=3401688 RepID=UPI003AADBABF